MRPPPPDFVIVGAPKCGTTSAATTLGSHSQICFSFLKEPHFFATDFPWRQEVQTIQEYDRLFQSASDSQIRGEASATYFASNVAIPAILERRSDAKFIAFLRNPIDMFVSFHNELLKSMVEDEPLPAKAWSLQDARRKGESMPPSCESPKYLDYRMMCSLGAQLQRMFEIVPEAQRHVIFFDDLVSRPRDVYLGIIEFLGISDEGTAEFVHENAFAQYDSKFAAMVMKSQLHNPTIKHIRTFVKPYLDAWGIRPLRWITQRHLQPVEKPVLEPAFVAELIEAFRDDIKIIEGLTGRNLSAWYDLESRTGSVNRPTETDTAGEP